MVHDRVLSHTNSRSARDKTPLATAILAVFSIATLGGFTYLGGEVGEPVTTVTDTRWLSAVAGWTQLWPIALAKTATFFGSAPAIVTITLVLLALLARKRRWFDIAYVILAGVGAIVLSTWTKDIVARVRPTAFFRVTAAGYSFPSGHTLNSTSLAIAIGFILWRTHWRQATKVAGTVVLTLYVICVATSRIVLGVHYPTDVLGGFLLGCGWGAVMMIVVLIYERRATPKPPRSRAVSASLSVADD